MLSALRVVRFMTSLDVGSSVGNPFPTVARWNRTRSAEAAYTPLGPCAASSVSSSFPANVKNIGASKTIASTVTIGLTGNGIHG